MSSINSSFNSSFSNTQLESVNAAHSQEKPAVSTQTPALNSTSLIGKQVLSASQQVETKTETTDVERKTLSSEKVQLNEKEPKNPQKKEKGFLSKTASKLMSGFEKAIKPKTSTVNSDSPFISLPPSPLVKELLIDENEPEGLRGEEWLKIVTDLKHYTGPRAQDLRENLTHRYFFFITIEELMTAFKDSLLSQKTPLDAMQYFELMKAFILDPDLHEEELKKPEVEDCLLAIHQHFKDLAKKEDGESFRVLDRKASQLVMDFYFRSHSKELFFFFKKLQIDSRWVLESTEQMESYAKDILFSQAQEKNGQFIVEFQKLVHDLEELRKSGDLSSNIHLSAQAKLWAASEGLSKRIATSTGRLELSDLTKKSKGKQDALTENFLDTFYLKELFADYHSKKIIDLNLCFSDSQETGVVLAAQDIVCIQRKLLQQLTPLELSGVFSDTLQKKVKLNIGNFHSRLVFWVRETLLAAVGIEERLKRIDFFWKLRDQLLDLKDYGSCNAIHNGLALRKTVAMDVYVKEELSRKETNEFYDQLFNPLRRFLNLRKRIEADKATIEKCLENIKRFEEAIPNQKLELKNEMEKEEENLLSEKLEESAYLPFIPTVLTALRDKIEHDLGVKLATEGQVINVFYEDMQIYQKLFNELKIPASLPSSFKELNTNLALLLCSVRTDEDRDNEIFEETTKINQKDQNWVRLKDFPEKDL